MQVRRCSIVVLEPHERLEFDLNLVATGGDGLRLGRHWVALMPPNESGIAVTVEEVVALGQLSPTQWVTWEDLILTHPRATLETLLEKGLILAQGSAAAARDDTLRDTHWRSLAAAQHYSSRWQGIDTEDVERQFAETRTGDLLSQLGPPPAVVREHGDATARLSLPAVAPSLLESLLGGRVTCRNFDQSRALTLDQFSTVLYRAYGARTVDDFAPGVPLLKKGVPSAGGLHPTEAYLLVQHVAGIEPGLYHYHPVAHALEPIRYLSADDAKALARRFVAAQGYFVDAHVMLIPTVRFRRNFWKYRNHAKAYRALILDVGHLSQTLYLAATELNLGAFITAAINEVDIEQAFGLDAIEQGPLAVSGFGIRASERKDVEFDPLHAVWPAG